MYCEQSIKPLRELEKLLTSLAPKIIFRKIFGIMNALEMQVDDDNYSIEAVQLLCKAILETAHLYKIENISIIEKHLNDFMSSFN